MSETFRPSWQNCCLPEDENLLKDEELAAINAMEDSIAPLGDDAVRIRELITGFESCYHEADRQAELIVRAIGTGQPPVESDERPPGRKQQLQDCRDILSAWCQDAFDQVRDRDVGGVSAEELVAFMAEPTPLKKWQVQRIIDKVTSALDPSQPYHNMALNAGDYGEPDEESSEERYKDHLDYLAKTAETTIHDTVDGRPAEISLALAVDRLTPCNWNFVDNLVVLLKAIGSDVHPDRSFACCERNILSTPLRDRLRVISNTLGAFWKNEETKEQIDDRLLALLGSATPVKCWLAACLDKTIRLQLDPHNVKRMYEWVAEWLK
ncbi:MAG: hypothetical protein JSW47_21460 [Phycisphaerales bacterium]|nr:MAG: hypothetical protein JSW47_21460 [Phycisphaerales bacterium]